MSVENEPRVTHTSETYGEAHKLPNAEVIDQGRYTEYDIALEEAEGDPRIVATRAEIAMRPDVTYSVVK